MGTIKQTAFRFTRDDLALLDAVQRKLGIMNRTDLLRMAIRALAEAQGVTADVVARASKARPQRRA